MVEENFFFVLPVKEKESKSLHNEQLENLVLINFKDSLKN